MAKLFFNASKLQDAKGEYIFWCDGMGTTGALSTSLSHAANFVFKLHCAFGIAVEKTENVHLYPLMDGMYVTSTSREAIQDVIRIAYTELANEFLANEEVTKHFIVRGAVAYGATLHGEEVPDDAFIEGKGDKSKEEFQNSSLNKTRAKLLLSAVMAIAYQAESDAPPFGVYVHESALNVPQLIDSSDKGFQSRLWFWWRGKDNLKLKKIAKKLAPALKAYFDKAEKESQNLAYPVDKIKKHRESLSEYFCDVLPQKE